MRRTGIIDGLWSDGGAFAPPALVNREARLDELWAKQTAQTLLPLGSNRRR
jgi:hypothetical protein